MALGLQGSASQIYKASDHTCCPAVRYK